jgi:ABC-type amino acid transport substrate-binding protein
VKFLQNLGIAVDDSSSDGLTCIRKVMGGRARFFYMNDLTLAQLVRDNHLQKDVRILKAVLHEEPSYFWLSRRQSTEVAERLNRDLARLDSNGELARIYRRYGDLNTDRP